MSTIFESCLIATVLFASVERSVVNAGGGEYRLNEWITMNRFHRNFNTKAAELKCSHLQAKF